jgi:predicted membrane protein
MRRNTLAMVSSLLLLMQVLAMRWNVVIGGQMFSKSMRGFREIYVPGLFEKEGILPTFEQGRPKAIPSVATG